MTSTLYIWSFCLNNIGCESLIRIITLIEAPMIPDQIPNKKYIVPISLWLVDCIHRFYSPISCKLINFL